MVMMANQIADYSYNSELVGKMVMRANERYCYLRKSVPVRKRARKAI
jgi:hypothetical protein